jgi:hypothetical protein
MVGVMIFLSALSLLFYIQKWYQKGTFRIHMDCISTVNNTSVICDIYSLSKI